MVGECQWLSSWFEDCDYEIIEIIKNYGLPQEGNMRRCEVSAPCRA